MSRGKNGASTKHPVAKLSSMGSATTESITAERGGAANPLAGITAETTLTELEAQLRAHGCNDVAGTIPPVTARKLEIRRRAHSETAGKLLEGLNLTALEYTGWCLFSILLEAEPPTMSDWMTHRRKVLEGACRHVGDALGDALYLRLEPTVIGGGR
jgi:hypothetical protein